MTLINILSVSFCDLVCQSIFHYIPIVRISTGRLAGFILLVFLDMAKNTILLGSMHVAKVIHDRKLESEEKNSKVSIFMTDTICRCDNDLNNNIIISILG